MRTLLATRDDSTGEQNVYGGNMDLLIHHAGAAGSRNEASGAGGAA